MFVPSYLNGSDGIFNLSYYDLLIGLDLTVFPSYYEPWGYTPMESVAFHIPTITTTLAGFGLWVKEHNAVYENAIEIIERGDDNDETVIREMSGAIRKYSALSAEQQNQARDNAFKVSRIALWKNFITYYREAYQVALSKSDLRITQAPAKDIVEQIPNIANRRAEMTPKWRRLLVETSIPKELSALQDLSRNLWWSWNYDAVELFESIDRKEWLRAGRNPILFLEHLSYEKLQFLASDVSFMARLEKTYSHYQEYMRHKSEKAGPEIAYFSMEYGLHSSLKIYSGGLGILAGDYLKEASDMNVSMTGVGLLYRYGYFTQMIAAGGDQIEQYELQDFTKIPVQPVRDEDGTWQSISIVLPGRTLYARIWKAQVGRVSLYLLDTDYEDNMDQDRPVTHQLYGGNEENRFKQELLLGVGGIRALRKLQIFPDVYHCNEGHAAFIGLERLFEYISKEKLSFSESLELVRSSTLFTTHTPVPAGHDSFEESLMRMYLSHYPDKLKISWQQFMGLGRINENDASERFSMSYLAANLSQGINGVSWLHGKVSQNIFSKMWPGYLPEELNVGYVTNGVHYPTWTAREWRHLYETRFGENFITHQTDTDFWNTIYQIPDKEIWEQRNLQRAKLFEILDWRISRNVRYKRDDIKYLIEVKDRIDDKVLTIGFARRFATYKRAHLLFSDLNRLSAIVNNPRMPVQFLFAGKAHPADKAGKDLIKMISGIAKRPEFVGKILFLENYDMNLASSMVQGVDVWMNTPTRPLEASGTSGEKAVMNGVLHFSVLDGWWYEGYKPESGWALKAEITYQDEALQDELDSETIYALLENEIVPAFYQRNQEGVPETWVSYIKNSIAQVASRFTTTRMLTDYTNQYYIPQAMRFEKMRKSDFAMAKRLSKWKKRIMRTWDDIELVDIKLSHETPAQGVVKLGKSYTIDITLDLLDLNPEEIGVEFVAVEQVEADHELKIAKVNAFEFHSTENGHTVFRGKISSDRTGAFDYGYRVFPKNEELPHRQDFPLIKWL
ncbi:MAG: alpha-glucan family phosphorylase, partial [Bacteroidales bacterium]|nr:alpha-glucan family phosphorylase [Bacteroidales bacterium]